MKVVSIFLCIALGAILVGCSTVDTRIQEKSAVFNSLDPQIQDRLKQGLIDVGYTSDMVYIALGKPNEVHNKTTDKGTETTWVYKNYWEEYQGSAVTGYHRWVYYDPGLKAYRVYWEPVRTDVYRQRSEERTRVSFLNDHVTVIESSKD